MLLSLGYLFTEQKEIDKVLQFLNIFIKNKVLTKKESFEKIIYTLYKLKDNSSEEMDFIPMIYKFYSEGRLS